MILVNCAHSDKLCANLEILKLCRGVRALVIPDAGVAAVDGWDKIESQIFRISPRRELLFDNLGVGGKHTQR